MEKIKNTLAENLTGAGNSIVSEDNKFSLDQVPDLTGKVAVVTGGTEGIGYANSHTLLAHNISKLFVLSPSQEIYANFQEGITNDLGSDKLQHVVWKQVDLSDFEQVESVAKEILDETDRIDILINGAGRGIMSFDTNKNGIDRHMAINHIGHVILTSTLLPLLKKTASTDKVRVVNISSNAHQGAPKETSFASIDELKKDYGPNPLYGRSKLANILYAKYLAKHLSSSHPNIYANAIHPGFVETRQSTEHIQEPFPVLGKIVKGANPIKKDVFEGSISTMYAATFVERTGEYICPPKVLERGSDLANDMELAEQLMRLTREIVKETTGHELQDY